MWNLKNYKFGFDPWGLGLFLVIMLPNCIWFAVPAPNDILRAESVTPLLDTVGQVFQVVLAAALCGVVNTARSGPVSRGYTAGVILCVLLYFAGWAAYYAGAAGSAVILTLCLAPCGAFLLFSAARRTAPVLIAGAGFTVCHAICAAVNFIL